MTQPPTSPSPELETIVIAAGAAWAEARARDLRSQDRAIAGAWPGTMTEARACVLAAVGREQVSIERLRELARTAYDAARTAWRTVAEPDPEP